MARFNTAVFLIAIYLLFSASPISAGEINKNFPPDPAGIIITDRACVTVNTSGGSCALYAIMYNTRECTLVDVYRSAGLKEKLAWKKVYQWKPEMEGDSHPLPTPSVIAVFESEEKVNFSIIYMVKYYEGKVTFYLSYDIKTGRFEKGWSD